MINKMLKVQNVTKYYGNDLVFRNVNLKIKKGDVIIIFCKTRRNIWVTWSKWCWKNNNVSHDYGAFRCN